MTPTVMPEEAVDPAHPLGVAPGQVVVDGDDVDALAVEGVQVGGQRGDERLAFAGLHLRDPAAVQHDAADQLHVEVPHVQRALAGLADHREGFGQQVVQRLAVGEPLAEFDGLSPERLVRERLDFRFFGVDLGDERTDAFQLALVLGADDLRKERVDDHSRDRTGIPRFYPERGEGGVASEASEGLP